MQPAKQANWRFVVFLAFIGWAVSYMDRAMIGPVIPLLERDLHASNAEIGFFAVTLVYFAYVILQIPTGVWADRFGRRPLSWPAMGLFSIFSGLTGTATSLAQFGLWRFLTGFGEGTYFSSVVSLVQDSAPEEKRGIATAGSQSGISFGSGLAPLILGPLAAWVGWRWSFAVPAVLGLIVAYLFWRYLPEAKTIAARGAAGEAHPSIGQTLKDSFLEFKSMAPILRDRTVLLTGIAGFAAVYYLYIALTWTPSFLYQTEHLGIAMSGVLASIAPFAAIGGQFTFGYISDRFDHWGYTWVWYHVAIMLLVAAAILAIGLRRAEHRRAPAMA